jgi:uncharacterized protein (TIGR02646 family)
MIRLRRPAGVPPILAQEGAAQTGELRRQYDANRAAYQDGTARFTFDSAIYGHHSVKDTLKEMQHRKCCFCEAFVPHISSGDVEHHRPKAAFCQQDGDALERPGYYWLAYDWENLLFCCEMCNRRHKRNLFPLADPAARVRDPRQSVAQESPLFVNPAAEDPAQFISFHEEMPFAVAGNQRGAVTIASLGLAREELSDDRLRKLETARILINLAVSQPHTPLGIQARAWVQQARGDEGQYAGMLRAELAQHYPRF